MFRFFERKISLDKENGTGDWELLHFFVEFQKSETALVLIIIIYFWKLKRSPQNMKKEIVIRKFESR